MYNPGQVDSPTVTHFDAGSSPGQSVQPGGRSSFGGGSLLGSVVSTVGGLIDNWRNRVHERKMQKLQMEENQKNKEWQEEMYNKYESPTAQAQAMRAAGLNPAGNVQTQSVGSASSSPLPQGQPSTVGASIAGGVNMYLNERRLMREYKLAERKQAHEELIALQNHIREEVRLGMSQDEWNVQKQLYQEQIDTLKLGNHEKQIFNNWLDELVVDGINPTKNDALSTLANINYLNSQADHIKALTETENDLRNGRVTAQTLANMASSLEYSLRKEYGDKMADLSYREFKQKVERDERLREVYVALARNQQAKAAYDAALTELTYKDYLALPPWQRYMLSLGKEVVEKGAEFVL